MVCTARCRGVEPDLFGALGLAPPSSSARTAGSDRVRTARCRGATPEPSRAARCQSARRAHGGFACGSPPGPGSIDVQAAVTPRAPCRKVIVPERVPMGVGAPGGMKPAAPERFVSWQSRWAGRTRTHETRGTMAWLSHSCWRNERFLPCSCRHMTSSPSSCAIGLGDLIAGLSVRGLLTPVLGWRNHAAGRFPVHSTPRQLRCGGIGYARPKCAPRAI